ncbi:hypothetical protein NDU88_006695 [Pleurodeles waltl]|uniref:Uncharacterized protein n=1 Tax=Pleurodeles waltl TaxID=8319 RepID=A0AAV7NV59_PLEWA|nr:hypothetical protein NDU88_006695 [Pleurodeles waltl]
MGAVLDIRVVHGLVAFDRVVALNVSYFSDNNNMLQKDDSYIGRDRVETKSLIRRSFPGVPLPGNKVSHKTRIQRLSLVSWRLRCQETRSLVRRVSVAKQLSNQRRA